MQELQTTKHGKVLTEDQAVPMLSETGERLTLIRSSVPSGEESIRLAAVFRLIGDPTRARILYALLESGELCVGDLSTVVGMSETAVSHALRLLRTAGIVRRRRLSRMAYYSLQDAHVSTLLELARDHLRHS